ncbi:MAG: hypothetical protein LBF78_01145 [Treponema sp.]|jgi:hypothetical protein|nr:hypothetical protein [Treponema sp.]
MKKVIKIAIITLAVVVAAVGVLFVVIPLATSKKAEAVLAEAFTEAGVPEDMWSAGRVYYVPLLGHLTVEKLEFGERGVGAFLEAKKVTLALNTNSEELFAGSVDIQGLSFSAANMGVTVKDLSLNDFSVDKTLFRDSPVKAVKKLGNIRLSDVLFMRKEQRFFSLGRLNVDAGYAEGKGMLPSSVSLKELAIDIRQLIPFSALRPEYRLSNLELKNSFSGGVYTASLVTDWANLFTIKADLGLSLPRTFLASGDISEFALFDYKRDLMMDSLALTYTDKSLLDHVFELAGLSGGRAYAAEQLSETLMMFAVMGGVDAERFVAEVANFIEKPGKFELKTSLDSPVNFEGISRNPFMANLSLSINGGKPFTTGGY